MWQELIDKYEGTEIRRKETAAHEEQQLNEANEEKARALKQEILLKIGQERAVKQGCLRLEDPFEIAFPSWKIPFLNHVFPRINPKYPLAWTTLDVRKVAKDMKKSGFDEDKVYSTVAKRLEASIPPELKKRYHIRYEATKIGCDEDSCSVRPAFFEVCWNNQCWFKKNGQPS